LDRGRQIDDAGVDQVLESVFDLEGGRGRGVAANGAVEQGDETVVAAEGDSLHGDLLRS
jgi:hypothetical protein